MDRKPAPDWADHNALSDRLSTLEDADIFELERRLVRLETAFDRLSHNEYLANARRRDQQDADPVRRGILAGLRDIAVKLDWLARQPDRADRGEEADTGLLLAFEHVCAIAGRDADLVGSQISDAYQRVKGRKP